jgi:polyisoprenyl-teichoic acid--peptidoglycan teichoic acid transferase
VKKYRGRRLLRWMLILGASAAVVVNAVLGAALVFGNRTFDKVERVQVKPGLLEPAEPKLPLNILVVGSDSRADLDTADQRSFGDDTQVEGQRSDTMMLVHADPRTGQIGVLSIPRDLYVPLSGIGRNDRINMAFFEGGHDSLIETIQNTLGITINHFVEVDFVGFRDVVNAVDGVPVFVAHPARDRVTGLDITAEGCVTLAGEQALAYVRSRNYQEQVNGRWRNDPTSDFGRIKRQQGFMRHTLERAVSRGARNPAKLNSLLGAVLDSMRVDDAFSRKDIARLANQLRNVDPEAVRTYVIPTFPATINGASVLRLDTDRLDAVLNRFSGFAPFRPSPKQVRLRVSGSSGSPVRVDAASSSTSTSAAPPRRRRRATTTTSSTIPLVQRQADQAESALARVGFVVVGGAGAADSTVPETAPAAATPDGASSTIAISTIATATSTIVTTGNTATSLTSPLPTAGTSNATGTLAALTPVASGSVRIRYRPESLEHARLVTAWFDETPILVPDSSLAGVDVEIDLAERFAGVRATRKTGVEEDVNDEAIGRRCDDDVVAGKQSSDAVVGDSRVSDTSTP